MLGPLGRTAPSAGRRWRRRPYLSAALVLVVALVLGELIDQLVDSYGPTGQRADATWVAGVAPIAVESGALSVPLGELRSAASSTDRVHLAALVATIVNGSQQALANYRALGLVAPSARDAALATTVFSDRLTAARSVASAVSFATGPGRDTAAAATALASAALTIKASNTAYRELTVSLGAGHGHLRLPSGQTWIGDQSAWSARAMANFAAALSANTALRSRASLSLVAISLDPLPVHITGLPVVTTTTTTLPPPTSTTSSLSATTSTVFGTATTGSSTTTTGASVSTTTIPVHLSQVPPAGSRSCLPPTTSVSVDVVVANAGDGMARAVRIVASLVPSGTTAPAPTAARTVTIGVGASVDVTLGPLHLLTKVTSYTLEVSAARPASAAVSDHLTVATSC